MIVSRVPAKVNITARSLKAELYEEAPRSQHISKLLESELLDLYFAILIAVPVAFFIKSLWF